MQAKVDAMNKILDFARKAQEVTLDLAARGYKVKSDGRLYARDHDWLMQRIDESTANLFQGADCFLQFYNYTLTHYCHGSYKVIKIMVSVRYGAGESWEYLTRSFEFILVPCEGMPTGELIDQTLQPEPLTLDQLQQAEARNQELRLLISSAQSEINKLQIQYLWGN